MENYSVCQLQKDMRFEGFLLVRSAEKRKDVKGNDYVDMNLTDRTGEINCKIWNWESSAEMPENGSVVKIRGTYQQESLIPHVLLQLAYRITLHLKIHPRQNGASPPGPFSLARLAKVVYSLSHASFTVPRGPLRCLAIITSPMFLSSVSLL